MKSFLTSYITALSQQYDPYSVSWDACKVPGSNKSIAPIISPSCHKQYFSITKLFLHTPCNSCACIFHQLKREQPQICTVSVYRLHP
ncbi:hypothetical protein DSECCO2_572700 [anaerobic digester metagenome]